MTIQILKPILIMEEAAKTLNEGAIIFIYRDGNVIRMETKFGKNPYVWRNEKWKVMR